jgi:hypothetical protein
MNLEAEHGIPQVLESALRIHSEKKNCFSLFWVASSAIQQLTAAPILITHRAYANRLGEDGRPLAGDDRRQGPQSEHHFSSWRATIRSPSSPQMATVTIPMDSTRSSPAASASCPFPMRSPSAAVPRLRPRLPAPGSPTTRSISGSGACAPFGASCVGRSRPATSIYASRTFCSRQRTCRCHPGCPVLLFEHNVEYLIWQRLANLETSPWKRALFEMEWRKVRACEAKAVRRAA